MIVAAVLVAAACASEHDSDKSQDANGFRCRGTLADGGCFSMPANCPVTVPHGTQPVCPADTELIPVEEDDCKRKLICID